MARSTTWTFGVDEVLLTDDDGEALTDDLGEALTAYDRQSTGPRLTVWEATE